MVQLQHAAGHDGLLTGGVRLLTNQLQLNAYGEVDHCAGYEAGGKNFACPGCSKRFGSSQAIISHCENRPDCRQYLSQVYGIM